MPIKLMQDNLVVASDLRYEYIERCKYSILLREF